MRFSRFVLPVLLIAVAVMIFATSSGPAETPDAFDQDTTLSEAQLASQDTGKPVLVLATADWCAPCQRLKRTTLAEPEVNNLIAEKTEPVYLDLTDAANDPELAATAQRLGIQGIPDLVLLRHGEIVSRRVGGASADELIAWLDSH